jgi:hypothetical protein
MSSSSEEKLALIQKEVDEAASIAGMDNNYPPPWTEVVQAILDDEYCKECGGHPTPSRIIQRLHYSHCSKYTPKD